jgi:alginate O-acetyltransferase complex protein AlgI
MVFSSYLFLFYFLPAALLLYYASPPRGRHLILTIVSYVFYGWANPLFVPLLLFSTVVDHVSAHAIDRSRGTSRARRVLIAALCTNLALLGFFKYYNFGAENIDALAQAMGLPAWGLGALRVTLPLGISFYTFQSMSYTIDVYRGILEPIRKYRPFLLFIVFFPQLVAGPIVRAAEFLPQMPRIRRPRAVVLGEGAFLIVSGYFLKTVCADNLAAHVDAHWHTGYADAANSALLLALSAMFAGQIFCDFAGYSNIARGLAYMLGYRLLVNFNAPFIAASFKNFWERWHITLSRWLRDYLYVPLGGNRGSRLLTYRNLLLVMLLGGLWHGAAWTFVIWGGIHGGAMSVERWTRERFTNFHMPAWLAWLITFHVVCLAWVFFRSPDLHTAFDMIGQVFAGGPSPLVTLPMVFLVVATIALQALPGDFWERGEAWLVTRPVAAQGIAIGAILVIADAAVGQNGVAPFIYFQF